LSFEIVIAKFKMNKSPGSKQISPKLIQAGGKTFWLVIHELNSFWNKE
jgi:hypothetical protein